MTITKLGLYGGPAILDPVVSADDITDNGLIETVIQAVYKLLKTLIGVNNVTSVSVGYMEQAPLLPYIVCYPGLISCTSGDTKLNTYEDHRIYFYVYADTNAGCKAILESIKDTFDKERLEIFPSYYIQLSMFFNSYRIKEIEEGMWEGSLTFVVSVYRKAHTSYLSIISDGTDLFEAIYNRYSTLINKDTCGEKLISQTSTLPYINITELDNNSVQEDTGGSTLETIFTFTIYSDRLLELLYLYLKFTTLLDFARLTFNNVHTQLLRKQDHFVQIEESYWKCNIEYILGDYQK